MIRSWRYTLKLWAACRFGRPLRLPPGQYRLRGMNPRRQRIVVVRHEQEAQRTNATQAAPEAGGDPGASA
jgi:hypothetical protein